MKKKHNLNVFKIFQISVVLTMMLTTVGSCRHYTPDIYTSGAKKEFSRVFGSSEFIEYLENSASDSKFKEVFNFNLFGPLEFIEYLKNNTSDIVYKINDPIVDWIREEHLSKLMELLDSQEPCLPVKDIRSSRITFIDFSSPTLTFELSTVGNEAAFLIEGFQKNCYPPRGASFMFAKYGGEEVVRNC